MLVCLSVRTVLLHLAMTATELRKYWNAAPFTPFNIVLPDGERVPVPHPDFLTVSPSGRIAHVWKKDDDWSSIDVFLITSVETARHKSRAKGK